MPLEPAWRSHSLESNTFSDSVEGGLQIKCVTMMARSQVTLIYLAPPWYVPDFVC